MLGLRALEADAASESSGLSDTTAWCWPLLLSWALSHWKPLVFEISSLWLPASSVALSCSVWCAAGGCTPDVVPFLCWWQHFCPCLSWEGKEPNHTPHNHSPTNYRQTELNHQVDSAWKKLNQIDDDIRKLSETLLIRARCILTLPEEAGTSDTRALMKDICGERQVLFFPYSLQT